MSEKPESDEFEDEEADEPVVGDTDVDLDQVIDFDRPDGRLAAFVNLYSTPS